MSPISKSRIFALIVVFLAALPVVAQEQNNCLKGTHITICGTERRITTDLGDQFDPHLSGNIIVDTDARGIDLDVWYYDLAANTEAAATTASGDQELTGVGDGLIVYADYTNYDIFLFRASTGGENLTHNTVTASTDPATNGSIVAWSDNRDGNFEIYAKNISTGELRRISDSPDRDQRPAVNNGKIVWQRCTLAICDIYMHDWGTTTTTKVTNTPYDDERNADISGSIIVYQGTRDGDTDIFSFDLSTNRETRLSFPANQYDPHINRDWVSFEDLATGIPHLKLWHLPTGDVFDLTQVPGGPPATASQFLNDIDGNRVVYTDDRAGQLDIYLFEFHIQSADTAPPVLHGLTNQTVDATTPQGTSVTLNVTATDEDPVNPAVTCSLAQAGTAIDIPPVGSSLFPFGTWTVICTATDAANNTASGSFTVLVKAAAEQVADLVALVNGFNLKQGIENSLDAKLQNAEAAMAAASAGNRANVCNLMSSFINETAAQSVKAISATDAQVLITKARQIQAVLGCFVW